MQILSVKIQTIMKACIEKIKIIYEFYLSVFADGFKLLPITLLSISFIKLLRLSLVTFVFLQLFYFYNKFTILQKYTLNYEDYLYLFFTFFIFPIFFIYEKFYTGNFFAFLYDKRLNSLFHDMTMQRLVLFRNIFKLWLVFIISQTRLLIDVIIFFVLFLVYLLIFYSNNLFSLPITYLYIFFALLISSPLFILLSLYIFRVFSFIFIFWKNEDRLNLWQSVKINHNLTKQKKIFFWSLYILFRIIEISLILFFAYILYYYLINLKDIIGFNLNLLLIMFYSIFAFIFIVSLDSVFWIRLYNLVEGKKANKNFYINKIIIKNFKKTVFINLILLTLFFILIYSNTIFLKNRLENSTLEQIVKYPLIIKMYNSEDFSTEKYFSTLYANGIAINIYRQNKDLLAKPLSSEINNEFIPNSINLFQTDFFNLNQLTVPDKSAITFKKAIELTTQNKIAMFSYMQDIKTAEILKGELKPENSYYLLLFTDNINVYNYIKENIPYVRVNLLLKDVDLDNYEDKILFTFWSDLSKLDINKIRAKNIKVYAILKKGEQAKNIDNLNKVRGVMTDLPELNFKETRSITSKDIYTDLIKSPLKFFGF